MPKNRSVDINYKEDLKIAKFYALQKIKLLIVGIGSIGTKHLSNILGKAEVSIYDEDVSKVYKISKKYKVKYF